MPAADLFVARPRIGRQQDLHPLERAQGYLKMRGTVAIQLPPSRCGLSSISADLVTTCPLADAVTLKATTRYTYNAIGFVTAITDPIGSVTHLRPAACRSGPPPAGRQRSSR